MRAPLWTTLVLTLFAACSGAGSGEPVRVRVPEGASFAQVADSLAEHEIIGNAFVFSLYARVTGKADRVKPGTYAFRSGTGWATILDDLVAGRVLNYRVVVPEGFDIADIAPRIAEVSGASPDSITSLLMDSAYAESLGVPGPTLEGYLYPATYSLPVDTRAERVIETMVESYRDVWTAERRASAELRGMTERQVVTLASIIEKEARVAEEMPLISAVYHNRLRIGMALQADPTVQYALGTHRERLLYAAIDSVADNPYNTYRHRGLPPGPIGSPSTRAIDAALAPADTSVLYFVARPDGSHVFTRTLDEHNRAKESIRRQSALGR
jgi:UPF0755 protein